MTGRYSKYLPSRLAARYQEAQKDPDLLALRDEVALLDSRLGEVIGKIDTGETGAIWENLKEANSELRTAMNKKDNASMTKALQKMTALIENGATEIEAWSEIYSLLDQRRRLVESERKRLVEMQQMITSERALVMLGVITDTIQRHVTDRSVLAAITEDFRRLTLVEAG